jgi:hypothetical protein
MSNYDHRSPEEIAEKVRLVRQQEEKARTDQRILDLEIANAAKAERNHDSCTAPR